MWNFHCYTATSYKITNTDNQKQHLASYCYCEVTNKTDQGRWTCNSVPSYCVLLSSRTTKDSTSEEWSLFALTSHLAMALVLAHTTHPTAGQQEDNLHNTLDYIQQTGADYKPGNRGTTAVMSHNIPIYLC